MFGCAKANIPKLQHNAVLCGSLLVCQAFIQTPLVWEGNSKHWGNMLVWGCAPSGVQALQEQS